MSRFWYIIKTVGTAWAKDPSLKKHEKPDDDLAAIAIDSTGLKKFGRDEWHQEKHKVLAKRSWRKLHIAVEGLCLGKSISRLGILQHMGLTTKMQFI